MSLFARIKPTPPSHLHQNNLEIETKIFKLIESCFELIRASHGFRKKGFKATLIRLGGIDESVYANL